MSAPTFDLTGPLPTGTTVLEASAGTGKTYTIAGLVTRFVAEGRAAVDELLVVTFGRAATAELRDRVRERLVSTRDALADPAAARTSSDAVVRHLAAADVERRRARLSAALAGFDAATVATIHEFCRQVLTSLGTAADVDPTATLVEDVDDLVEEVCDDLYVRFAVHAGVPPFGRDVALRIAREAVARPDARIAPPGTTPNTPEDLRVRFAQGVRREVAARKRSRRVMGFDDLLIRLRDALTDGTAGPTACERLRRRYSVVLVDEFQDTDAVQWDVLRTAFHGQDRPLVLIGDPKQAIYAFRGADVNSYLDAVAVAGTTATLGTNFRSDPAVLDGTAQLLRGAALGDEGIVVHPVRAHHPRPALVGPDGAGDPTPVRLRVLRRDGLPVTARTGVPAVADVRAAVARDTAAEVVSVLGQGLRVRPHRGGPERDLAAGDVAVLVRTGAQAVLVQEELRRRNVPCVLSRGPSVFATPAAREWLWLLEAVEQPHRAPRVRRAALTSFVGRTTTDLDAGGDHATDDLSVQLREWGALLAERGVAATFAALAEQHRLAARLLAVDGGERRLTDLRHIAEVLHGESALNPGGGVSSLLSWLRGRVEEAAGDNDRERSRRLDTDRAAVQIATVHTSKGLEFEVVCVPYGWDCPGGGSQDRLPVAHVPDGDGPATRALHVGGPAAPGYDAHCRAADTEDLGEELRLLYVALTRAVSRLVVWWAPATNTQRGALHRLLLTDDPRRIPEKLPLPTDDALRAVLAARFPAGGPVAVEDVPLTAPLRRRPTPAVTATDLRVARFGATVDGDWRRTSYSGLTRGVHDTAGPGRAVLSEPEVEATTDEADAEVGGPVEAPDPHGWRQVPSPLSDLPAGTGFGTLVHAVLEGFDPAVPDRPAHLAALARDQFAPALAEPLAAALDPVLRTPLGPLASGRSLQDFAVGDRLAELDFELPLAGGDDAGPGGSRLGDLAALLRTHLGPADPVHRYADLLEDPALAAEGLRGYLTGSIDAVLRDGDRFLVVDYKTNRLAGPGEPLTAWHYRREALDEAVLAAHYPLQALLYSVALHRFLRWRAPGYDPATHLGGSLYLFLRGMCGPGTAPGPDGVPPGVWSWAPPAALVVAVSELLAGRNA
ncbi:UvrD-helicase domain-containing protein [Kineococcus sp. SYSU DK001]|uniref:UvrD-helicase domain-containing protein n=1 Tax=Kineococcus sp. SYSU DK001 TaxID=3383122 RepID=UPI003D7DE21F